MRREKYEILDHKELLKILKKCQVCRLAVNNDGYPYIVPVNYGFEEVNEEIYIYIHGADAGTKKELIKKDNRVAFEMDYHEDATINMPSCNSYMNYYSICGTGNITFVKDQEKRNALTYIMKHYTDKPIEILEEKLIHTMVLKIEIKEITGKFLKH